MKDNTYKDGFKYIYRTYNAPSPSAKVIEDSLNGLGKKGWEICGLHFEKAKENAGYEFEWRVFVWFKQRLIH